MNSEYIETIIVRGINLIIFICLTLLNYYIISYYFPDNNFMLLIVECIIFMYMQIYFPIFTISLKNNDN